MSLVQFECSSYQKTNNRFTVSRCFCRAIFSLRQFELIKFTNFFSSTVIQLITAEDEKAEYLDEEFPESDNSESESDRNYY